MTISIRILIKTPKKIPIRIPIRISIRISDKNSYNFFDKNTVKNTDKNSNKNSNNNSDNKNRTYCNITKKASGWTSRILISPVFPELSARPPKNIASKTGEAIARNILWHLKTWNRITLV